MIRIFAFYEDAAKVSLIINAEHIVTRETRKDLFKGGSFRVTNGDLKAFEFYDKYKGKLSLSSIRAADLVLLQAEYDEHRNFFFFPDINNAATTYFEVRWLGQWNYKPDKFTGRYTLTINLKAV